MPKPRSITLDEIDYRLLALLQQDAGRALYELGDLVGLSPSAVQRRITRYRAAGLITRQVALIDPTVIAGVVFAVVLVTLERESTELHAAFRDRLRAVSEVQQCYDVAGEWDYVVILVTAGMARFRELADQLFTDDPNVKRFDTLPVFDVIKAGPEIPIPET